jgi:hypothetical protein
MRPENMNAIIVDISSIIQTSPERLEISEGVPGSRNNKKSEIKIENRKLLSKTRQGGHKKLISIADILKSISDWDVVFH